VKSFKRHSYKPYLFGRLQGFARTQLGPNEALLHCPRCGLVVKQGAVKQFWVNGRWTRTRPVCVVLEDNA
jgi:hypothetical protein